jgi:hypothetical protein
MVLLVLLGAGALWLYQDVLAPSPASERVYADTSQTEPERRRSAKQALERLQEQVRQPAAPAAPADQAAPGSPSSLPPKDPDQFGVTITEKDANDLVASLPEVQQALEQANVSELHLRFEPDRLVAEARVPVVGGMKARVTATGRVYAEDGDLGYETQSVRIGSIPAPKALREELDRQLGASIRQLNQRFHGRIDTVQVREDALEVRGKL